MTRDRPHQEGGPTPEVVGGNKFSSSDAIRFWRDASQWTSFGAHFDAVPLREADSRRQGPDAPPQPVKVGAFVGESPTGRIGRFTTEWPGACPSARRGGNHQYGYGTDGPERRPTLAAQTTVNRCHPRRDRRGPAPAGSGRAAKSIAERAGPKSETPSPTQPAGQAGQSSKAERELVPQSESCVGATKRRYWVRSEGTNPDCRRDGKRGDGARLGKADTGNAFVRFDEGWVSAWWRRQRRSSASHQPIRLLFPDPGQVGGTSESETPEGRAGTRGTRPSRNSSETFGAPTASGIARSIAGRPSPVHPRRRRVGGVRQ